MLRRLMAALAFAGMIGLAACESYGPTPYQPGGDGARGYSETKIETTRWRVSFKGNSLTDKETVENYLLYRAAELTLQNGYDNFTVVNRDTDKNSRVREYGGYLDYFSYTYFIPRVGWVRSIEPYYSPGHYEQVTRYEAYAEILMGKGAKGTDPNQFEARQVSQNLASLIARPPQ